MRNSNKKKAVPMEQLFFMQLMIPTSKIFVIAVMMFFCVSCKTTVEHGSSISNNNKLIEEIRSSLINYNIDVGKEGLLAELKYLDSSANFFWVPPGYQSALNYDSVVTVLRENAPKLKSLNRKWTSLKIIPHTNTLASFVGTIKVVMVDINGSENTSSLIESGLMIKRSAGWKLLNGQTSILK